MLTIRRRYETQYNKYEHVNVLKNEFVSIFKQKFSSTKQIVLPISDCKDNVVDSSLLDDVVHFGLGVSGHVFPVDLKDLLKKNSFKNSQVKK